MLEKLIFPLIASGVFLIVAIIATFIVNRYESKPNKKRDKK